MFISNTERNEIKKTIESLSKIIGDMNVELMYLSAKVKVLEGTKQEDKKPRKKHTMSPETRAKMSQMMKERHAKYKLEQQEA